MGDKENKGTSVGISRLEMVLIAVALGLLVGIVIFDAVTAATAYPSKVTYVASQSSDASAVTSAAQTASVMQTESVAQTESEVQTESVAQTESAGQTESVAQTESEDTASLSININTATAEELQQLSGIGPVKAAAIVEYRETNGEFVSLEEIMEVKGIGEKTFEKIKEFITLS